MKAKKFQKDNGKEVKNMKRNSKKGFTLIELIAVIAILAILGAILVPTIAGYRTRAEKSNIQTSAKTVQDAIETWNADKDGDTSSSIVDSNYSTGIGWLVNAKMLDSAKIPACLSGSVGTISSLKEVAEGRFTVTSVNGINSTITIP